jgi:hypothetical protein
MTVCCCLLLADAATILLCRSVLCECDDACSKKRKKDDYGRVDLSNGTKRISRNVTERGGGGGTTFNCCLITQPRQRVNATTSTSTTQCHRKCGRAAPCRCRLSKTPHKQRARSVCCGKCRKWATRKSVESGECGVRDPKNPKPRLSHETHA